MVIIGKFLTIFIKIFQLLLNEFILALIIINVFMDINFLVFFENTLKIIPNSIAYILYVEAVVNVIYCKPSQIF